MALTWEQVKKANPQLVTYVTSDGTECHLGAFRFFARSADEAAEKIAARMQPARAAR